MSRNNLILSLILILAFGVSFAWSKKTELIKNETPIPNSSARTVSAQEIYPLFECSCCGKAIDQCTCPMAKERRAFVDGLTAGGVSEKEAILAYIKKYGLDSFIDESQGEEFRQELIEQAPADRPIIFVTPDSYDFGDVSQKQGIAVVIFEIKNEGEGDLIIEKLETSCGCTSASIVYRGEEGPKFAMPGHGINEEIGDWQIIISSKGIAQLKVYYDPNVHKDFRGTAIREVSIYSNDPINFQKKVSIEINQVD